jgi:hypothetical protein
VPGMNLIRVTETTSVGESNGTNLKPIIPIAFFKQVYENLEVTVLCQDGWHERLRSIYTTLGAKVLKYSFIIIITINNTIYCRCSILALRALL